MAKMYVLVGVVVVLNFGMPRVCCVVVVVVGRKVGDQFKLAPAHIYRRALSAT